eukprot:602070-Alexandrium_andersonii.AAC.1
MCTAVASDTSSAACPVRLSTRTTACWLPGRRRSPRVTKTGKSSFLRLASSSAWKVLVASCSCASSRVRTSRSDRSGSAELRNR